MQLAMFNVCSPSPQHYQHRLDGARGRGGRRAQGRGRPIGDPSACHYCERRGDWQAECPEKSREPALPGSDCGEEGTLEERTPDIGRHFSEPQVTHPTPTQLDKTPCILVIKDIRNFQS